MNISFSAIPVCMTFLIKFWNVNSRDLLVTFAGPRCKDCDTHTHVCVCVCNNTAAPCSFAIPTSVCVCSNKLPKPSEILGLQLGGLELSYIYSRRGARCANYLQLEWQMPIKTFAPWPIAIMSRLETFGEYSRSTHPLPPSLVKTWFRSGYVILYTNIVSAKWTLIVVCWSGRFADNMLVIFLLAYVLI